MGKISGFLLIENYSLNCQKTTGNVGTNYSNVSSLPRFVGMQGVHIVYRPKDHSQEDMGVKINEQTNKKKEETTTEAIIEETTTEKIRTTGNVVICTLACHCC